MILYFLIFHDNKILQIDQIEWLIPIEILARIIFCKYILNIKLYKHHKISIIMCIIGFIFFGITGLTFYKTKSFKLFTVFLSIFFENYMANKSNK